MTPKFNLLVLNSLLMRWKENIYRKICIAITLANNPSQVLFKYTDFAMRIFLVCVYYCLVLQFWLVRNDFGQTKLIATKMNLLGPNCDFRPIQFGPIHFGRDQIIMVKSKSIWFDQNHFGLTKTVLVT